MISNFAGDGVDKVIPTNREVAIVWALGKLNSAGEVTKHDLRTLSKDIQYLQKCSPIKMNTGPSMPIFIIFMQQSKTSCFLLGF